jgi:hypothetical protein
LCKNGFQHILAKQFLQKKKTALLIHPGEINKTMKNVQTVCTKKMYFKNVQIVWQTKVGNEFCIDRLANKS